MTILGQNEMQWGWRVACIPPVGDVLSLIVRLIELVGMTVDGVPDVRHYPNGNGKGGYGIQIYQPLVESWLVVSTWPDHGFLRITLSSCKPYDPVSVCTFLMENVGQVICQGGYDL